jgi:muconate cycloisomerase
MRITGAKIYELQIPFVEAFSHATKNRRFSDSFVVRLTAEDGTTGYGEGAARQYVTGEIVGRSIDYIQKQLFPIVSATDFAEITVGENDLAAIVENFPVNKTNASIVWNAAETAVELALIDCLLKRQNRSLGDVLPPVCETIVYSGVITTGSVETAAQHARRFKLFGIKQLKIKIDGENDFERIRAVREAVGDTVSLRLDANGAFGADEAVEILEKLSIFNNAAVEQPIKRGSIPELARVQVNSAIPVMVDESLITLSDAEELIAAKACDFFNLRVSKCGGISRTIEIARAAVQAGIKIQIGCQVGETAILSAAGRHLAAFLPAVEFVEGSFGNLLLVEDIGRDAVNFGHGGRARMLRGRGLGVTVRDEILEKYAVSIATLGKK